MTFSAIIQLLVMKEHMNDGIHGAQPKWHINEFNTSWPWEPILLGENVLMSALWCSEIIWLIGKHFSLFYNNNSNSILSNLKYTSSFLLRLISCQYLLHDHVCLIHEGSLVSTNQPNQDQLEPFCVVVLILYSSPKFSKYSLCRIAPFTVF